MAEEEEEAAAAEAAAYQQEKELVEQRAELRHLGLVLTYATWAIITWIIMVYGKLIYDMYGERTEDALVKSWGIGIAVGETGIVPRCRDALVSRMHCREDQKTRNSMRALHSRN